MRTQGYILRAAVLGSAALCSCILQPDARPADALGDEPREVARRFRMTEIAPGTMPDWWVSEPHENAGVALTSGEGTAPDLSVARDLAWRNARAAGRAVLGIEPVRVVAEQEAYSRPGPGEFVAYVLARCDGAGAPMLPMGGQRSGPARPRPAPVERAPAPQPDDTTPPPAPEARATPAAPEPPPAQPPPKPEPKPAAPADAGASRFPAWWFENARREDGAVRVCASGDGAELLVARRAAVEIARKRLAEAGVTGAVQTLFIDTKKLREGGFRVYVMAEAR